MASRPKFDADNPEWTEEDFARAQRPEDVLPPDVLAQFGKRRGPQKMPTKVPVSIRLSPAVVRYFKDKGPGWQSRIDEILTEIATRKPPAAKRHGAGSKRRRA